MRGNTCSHFDQDPSKNVFIPRRLTLAGKDTCLLERAKTASVAIRILSFSPNAKAGFGEEGLSTLVNLLSEMTKLSMT